MEELDVTSVVPGHSLGSVGELHPHDRPRNIYRPLLVLGSSLHETLTAIKEDRARYPTIDLHFSQTSPLATPVVVALPQNGIRLRFDGKDQRLRLIEVTDFKKIRLKNLDDGQGARFKRVYQIFGASYPGEYIPPKSGDTGIYVLSWPGIAFNFPLFHSAYAPGKDHVSLLGSHAASPATSMALFEGNSWPEVRNTLFTKAPSKPRTAAVAAQLRDMLPAEVEMAYIRGTGMMTLVRRSPALPFEIVLGQTTPQDLLTELGAPDATHKRDTHGILDQANLTRPRSTSRSASNSRSQPTPPSSYSSTGTDTFDADFDSGDAEDDAADRAGRETFWCYFRHGVDILVGPPSEAISTDSTQAQSPAVFPTSPHLVVLKVVIHGNVPGSYAFNRHRRLRWTLELSGASSVLTSEHTFDDIKSDLMQAFAHVWPESEMGRGKVVNRTWGVSPNDSSFFLPDADQDLVEGIGSEQWLGNTKLYSFPGLTFEVLKHGAICTLTVS